MGWETTSETKSADGRILAVTPIVNRLVRWVTNDVPAQPDLNSAYRIQVLLDAALNSQAELGRWIKIL